MNRNRFAGNLKQLKGKFREQWGWWTHRYSSVFTGKINQLAGKIQALYGGMRKWFEQGAWQYVLEKHVW
jgi:uncharacterized protein YjbJ (UPF0337 family)